MPNYHLAILKKLYLDAVLDGKKKIESRFTMTKRPPFGRVAAGDKIFFKVISGPVCAAATVSAVRNFENLTPQQVLNLRSEYNHLICGSDRYWRSKADCKFGLLIWLKNVELIEPIRISKRDWRAWVVLTERENFGLLKI